MKIKIGGKLNNIDKVIKTAKKLIDLPHNLFNLNNYPNILYKNNLPITYNQTSKNHPIRLMSGRSEYSGIVAMRNSLFSQKSRKIYLVGKGVMFDSGGLDLKSNMSNMHCDKAGMIIALCVANYLKGNVVAYCPITTNFVHNSQITPGDQIKIGKKTVTVTDTDAEGRLILAEAITELNASKNDIIITVATLTGAVEYAIGKKATGVFSPNNELLKKYADASHKANEYAWGLPLWDYLEKEFYRTNKINNWEKEIKCGATAGALFIKQFVPNPMNWLHLDIASSAFNGDGSANGVPIKSLVNFIRSIR